MRHSVRRSALCLVIVLLALPAPVLAHPLEGLGAGFVSGVLHPLTGLDHLLAMVAVGIWGTQLGAPVLWLLPVTFPLVMAAGGALGARAVPLDGVEIVVAGSALVLGLLIALRARLSLVLAAVLVGAFAVCHGYAHGVELPTAANPMAYGLGFVLVTGLLHASGIAIGLLERWRRGAVVLRCIGAGIGAVGTYLVVGLLR